MTQNNREGASLAQLEATLLSNDFQVFLEKLAIKFSTQITEIIVKKRNSRQARINECKDLSETVPVMQSFARFVNVMDQERFERDWNVTPLPTKSYPREVTADLADVVPSNSERFESVAWRPTTGEDCVTGVQVDFDDAMCPTWINVLRGHLNIRDLLICASRNPGRQLRPLLVRPRAWNMVEKNVLLSGTHIRGALFDFAVYVFHCGRLAIDVQGNLFLQLAKVESFEEVELWSDLFAFAEKELQLPSSSIRCIVLIECITAAFQLEQILFKIKNHALGLNLGLWDYAASCFARLPESPPGCGLLPSGRKSLSSDYGFISACRSAMIDICHRRGALCTGGMISQLNEVSGTTRQNAVLKKVGEAMAGCDGCLVLEEELAAPIVELFCQTRRQHPSLERETNVSDLGEQLLPSPEARFPTICDVVEGLEITILFILHWILLHRALFIFKGQVIDSAVAEIVRFQLREDISLLLLAKQPRNNPAPRISLSYLSHQEESGYADLQETDRSNTSVSTHVVLRNAVVKLLGILLPGRTIPADVVATDFSLGTGDNWKSVSAWRVATQLTLDLVTTDEPPLFITTWLSEHGGLPWTHDDMHYN